MKPRRLSGFRPHRLYSVATADAVYRETRRTLALTLAGIAPLFGGLVLAAHVEMPLLAELAGACEGARYLALCAYSPLYDVLAALLGLLFYGAFLLLLFRYVRNAPPPTVYCRHCDGAGWVRDLEPTDGRCPFCHHEVFAYYQHAVPTGRGLNVIKVLEQEVRGGVLIARRKTRGWWSRYWWPIH